MRRELFSLHLPNPDRVTADYAVLAGLSRDLRGGDLLNVCINAIYAGSTDPNPERWVVTHAMIEEEIAKTRNVTKSVARATANALVMNEKALPPRIVDRCVGSA